MRPLRREILLPDRRALCVCMHSLCFAPTHEVTTHGTPSASISGFAVTVIIAFAMAGAFHVPQNKTKNIALYEFFSIKLHSGKYISVTQRVAG